MTNTAVLPEGYTACRQIDLQHDIKTAVLVNLGSLVIGFAMVVAGHRWCPITVLMDGDAEPLQLLLRLMLSLAAMIAYMPLHELIHGILFRILGGKPARYGFTGLYAYAASDIYFTKGSYLLIALAPVAIWGIVLLVLNLLLPHGWVWWLVYLVQLFNISGAAGDLYVTVLFCRLPADILVRDSGVSMTVYAPR